MAEALKSTIELDAIIGQCIRYKSTLKTLTDLDREQIQERLTHWQKVAMHKEAKVLIEQYRQSQDPKKEDRIQALSFFLMPSREYEQICQDETIYERILAYKKILEVTEGADYSLEESYKSIKALFEHDEYDINFLIDQAVSKVNKKDAARLVLNEYYRQKKANPDTPADTIFRTLREKHEIINESAADMPRRWVLKLREAFKNHGVPIQSYSFLF